MARIFGRASSRGSVEPPPTVPDAILASPSITPRSPRVGSSDKPMLISVKPLAEGYDGGGGMRVGPVGLQEIRAGGSSSISFEDGSDAMASMRQRAAADQARAAEHRRSMDRGSSSKSLAEESSTKDALGAAEDWTDSGGLSEESAKAAVMRMGMVRQVSNKMVGAMRGGGTARSSAGKFKLDRAGNCRSQQAGSAAIAGRPARGGLRRRRRRARAAARSRRSDRR